MTLFLECIKAKQKKSQANTDPGSSLFFPVKRGLKMNCARKPNATLQFYRALQNYQYTLMFFHIPAGDNCKN